MSEHVCRYRETVVWSDWRRSGLLKERLARRLPLCETCGREQPARRPRQPVLAEVRAASPEALPPAGATGRTMAKALVRLGRGREGLLPTRGFLGNLARQGIPASLAEEWIEAFLRAGWIAVVRTPGSPSELVAVILLKTPALRELARPGEEGRRLSALREARARVAPLLHPKAAEIAALLAGPEAGRLRPSVIQALAALAAHVETGEVLAERVFATRYLGGSKGLLSPRGTVERLIGPLAEIGIREGASTTLLGGAGILQLDGSRLDLQAFAPFVGLTRESLERLEEVGFPAGGLFVIENLTVFEACCRGEVEAIRGALFAWSAGYPGRSIRKLVELAGAAGAPLRVWADLDLDGVRIARLTASWSTTGAAFFRMSPQDLEAAPSRHALPEPRAAAIRRDLEEKPEAPLADTLRALLDAGAWVEQEAFLAR